MTSEWVLDQNGHSVYVPIQSENFGPRRAQFYLEQHEDSKHEALRPNHPTKGARANRLMFVVQVCVLRFSGLTCMLTPCKEELREQWKLIHKKPSPKYEGTDIPERNNPANGNG